MKKDKHMPWLTPLVQRFVNTEACAKEQLNLPLAEIFARSQPRQKMPMNTYETIKNQDNMPNFQPVAFDRDSDKEYDSDDNEILIPDDSNKSQTNAKDNIITEADNPLIGRMNKS